MYRKILPYIVLTAVAVITASLPAAAQYPVSIQQVLDPSKGTLDPADAAAGIREALVKGADEAVKLVAKNDGYYENPEIKIPFPTEAKEVGSKLRSMSLSPTVNKMVILLNRAAEDAAASAVPIFTEAITNMTIQDAVSIVRGNSDAATKYLKRTTTQALREKFTPVVKASLDKVSAPMLWAEIMKVYNQIPFATKVNTDLVAYTTDQAIAGLFVMMAKEEAKIRKDPAQQTTAILKKVFGK